jgi:hypothetical protein
VRGLEKVSIRSAKVGSDHARTCAAATVAATDAAGCVTGRGVAFATTGGVDCIFGWTTGVTAAAGVVAANATLFTGVSAGVDAGGVAAVEAIAAVVVDAVVVAAAGVAAIAVSPSTRSSGAGNESACPSRIAGVD